MSCRLRDGLHHMTKSAIKSIRSVAVPVTDQDRAVALLEQLGFTVSMDAELQPGFRWIELVLPGGDASLALVTTGPELPTGIDTGVRLVPIRRAKMQPHAWFVDDIELHEYRHTIETVNSQLEKMGIERLAARTNVGFDLKVHAALIALICTNMN